jgi:acetyl esterase/lipase
LVFHTALACLGVVSPITSLSAAEPQTEPLWPDGAPGALGEEEKDRPKLILYKADPENSVGTAVVVCPGGGYGTLAMDHEGHQIAQWFNSFGVTAVILDYRHGGKGYGHPAPLQDAQRAIRTVRSRAESLGVSPDRIGIMGFSAGGHLASSAGTHFNTGSPVANDPIQQHSSRPDFLILCYPVISLTADYTHQGSKRNLLGESPDADLVENLSNEKQVTADTPPTFLFHTSEDRGVPPQNSIVFYLALHAAGVPAELHVFEKGRHGLGLAQSQTGTSAWPELAREWMRGRGLLPAAEGR